MKIIMSLNGKSKEVDSKDLKTMDDLDKLFKEVVEQEEISTTQNEEEKECNRGCCP